MSHDEAAETWKIKKAEIQSRIEKEIVDDAESDMAMRYAKRMYPVVNSDNTFAKAVQGERQEVAFKAYLAGIRQI